MPRRTPPDVWELAARLPQDRPYPTAEARDLGLTQRQLEQLVSAELVRRRVKGVYAPGGLPDTVETRLQILRYVVPPDCVIVDRTAGWLWAGDRVLAPGDHLRPPPLSIFSPPGHRLRNTLTQGGERTFGPHDLVELGGVTLTAPLRTACDLGRLLHRDQALAALDTLAGLGAFTLDELAAETTRFRRFRGVVQLRVLVLIVDPGSQSQGESILRLRWIDIGLPTPRCQVEVPTPWGQPYFLDIGCADGDLFGAEYDGEEFHGADRAEYDRRRRGWLREEAGWTLVVGRREQVMGQHQDIDLRLRVAWEQFRRSHPIHVV